MYGLRGGVVPIPRWILAFRVLQLLLAILVLGLAAYSLSVNRGGPLRPALISTIIIAALTIVPILLLTTPLHLAQRKLYDPRIALLLDGFATLYWLATFAVMASYHHIFRRWGRISTVFDSDFGVCGSCRKAWRTGVAATVFSAIEFLLFLLTTLLFLYYYHFHLAEAPAPGIGRRGVDKTSNGTTATGTGTGVNGETGAATTGHHTGEQHRMEQLPAQHSTHTGTGMGTTGHPNHTGTGLGTNGHTTHTGTETETTGHHVSGNHERPRTPVGQHIEPPPPAGRPRSLGGGPGGYGSYENRSNTGYRAESRDRQVYGSDRQVV